MNFRREKRLKVKALFDLTPLVNVVLLLLFFFLLSGTFGGGASLPMEAATLEGPVSFQEKGIEVQLLAGEGGPDNGGVVRVNGQEVAAWDDISATLRDWHAADAEGLLVIAPEKSLPTERLLKVIALANEIGVEHYVIAAKSAER